MPCRKPPPPPPYLPNISTLIFRSSTLSSLAGQMTARFLLHLREWDHRISNQETDQWNTFGEAGNLSSIRFKKSDPPATQWTIKDVLDDDPLLKPLGSTVNSEDKSFGASHYRTQDSESIAT